MAAFFIAVDRLIRAAAVAAIAVASALMLMVAVAITADVASTGLLRSPIPVVTEVSSAALAVIVFGSLAFAQYRRQNVRVDIVLLMLPASVQRLLHGISLLISLAIFVLLARRTTAGAVTSWNTAETAMALITFPVYPFKIGVAVGAWIGVAEFARQLIRLAFGVDEAQSEGGTQASERA